MRQLRVLIVSLIMIATVSQAAVYKKAGFFFSVVNTVTDYQFGGVGVQYEIGRGDTWGALGAEFRVSYDMYSGTDTYEDDRECSIVPIEIGAKYAKPTGKYWAPYISGGVGLYMFEDFSAYNYDDIFGYHGAIGTEFYLNKQFGMYLQLKYTQATDDLEGNGYGNRYGIEGLGGDMGMFLSF